MGVPGRTPPHHHGRVQAREAQSPVERSHGCGHAMAQLEREGSRGRQDRANKHEENHACTAHEGGLRARHSVEILSPARAATET